MAKLYFISYSNSYIEIPTYVKYPDEINVDAIHDEVYRDVENAYFTTEPRAVFAEVVGIDFNKEMGITNDSEDEDLEDIEPLEIEPIPGQEIEENKTTIIENYNEEIKTSKPKFIFINNNLFDKTALKNSNWLHRRNSLILKKASKGNLSYLEKITEIVYDYWNIDMNFIQENYQYIKTFNETELWQRIDN